MDQPAESTGIIVLGMHRSGTSMTSEMVCRWGAYPGEGERFDTRVRKWNQHGQWEYLPLVGLNDDLLGALNSSWKVPPGFEANDRLVGFARSGLFRKRALRLLAKMKAGGSPWIWKDPRLCLLLPFWKQLWGRVIYLVPVRNPLDIATSLSKRGNVLDSVALILWQRYMSSVIADEDVLNQSLFFPYEEVLELDSDVRKRICQYLNAETGCCDKGGDDRLSAMAQAIEPELRKNRDTSSFSSDTEGEPEQRKLYQVLIQHAHGVPCQRRISIGMPEGWRKRLIDANLVIDKKRSWFLLRQTLRPVKRKLLPFVRQFGG
jgi:hypothetical protein